MPYGWLKRNARHFFVQWVKQNKANRATLARVFPRSHSQVATYVYFMFWLVHVDCLWPLWLASVTARVLFLRRSSGNRSSRHSVYSIETASMIEKNKKNTGSALGEKISRAALQNYSFSCQFSCWRNVASYPIRYFVSHFLTVYRTIR